jgi:SAM-dependent methyltransferase
MSESEMDPTTRFSDRAADYVRHRPSYPDAAIDAVLDALGDPATLVAADVGAGTGISARQLADRGVRVIAVEPNADMRAVADPHPRVEWRDGTAEATSLPDAAVDLVLCAQAFHWFRQREAVAEFHRVLRPRGRLVVMWNARDRQDPFTRGFIAAIHTVNGEHEAERREIEPGAIEGAGLFTPPELRTFPHAQRLDRDGVLGRAASASYVPKAGEGWERLRAMLVALHAGFADADGFVTMRYVTRVYVSSRR